MKQLDTDIVIGSVLHLLLGVFCNDFWISLEEHLGPTSLLLQGVPVKCTASLCRGSQLPEDAAGALTQGNFSSLRAHWPLWAHPISGAAMGAGDKLGSGSQAWDGEAAQPQGAPGKAVSPSLRGLGHQHLPSMRSSV